MKKFYFYAGLLIAALSSHSIVAQQINFESVSLPGSETFWNGSDLSGTHNNFTFSQNINLNEFSFENIYDTTYTLTYGWWSTGWAFSNQTADNLVGTTGQHSSYAGGAAEGNNYSVGQDGSEIIITPTGQNAIKVNSLKITNSNYAAHSMLNGDLFGKQFGSSLNADGINDGTNGEDWCLLSIVGHKIDGTTDTIEFYLADYRFSNSTEDYIVKNWTLVDVSSLEYVNKLEFLMSSSDVGAFGMNTPGFFVIDDIQYTVTSTASINEFNNSNNVEVYPNPTNGMVNIVSNQLFSTIEIMDITGKIVYTNASPSYFETLDLSYLPAGVYHIKSTSTTSQVVKKLIKQ
jgi:hypothetical protein